MKKYSITAHIRVKNDLAEAKDFFNSRRKGLGLQFLTDYRNSLSKLKINPLYQIRYDLKLKFQLAFYPYHLDLLEIWKNEKLYK